MLEFEDTAGSVDERSTERMNFRTKPRIKAAALSGVDDSVFTMNAAYKAARDVIEAHEATVFSPADHAIFFEALQRSTTRPGRPNGCGKPSRLIARRDRAVRS